MSRNWSVDVGAFGKMKVPKEVLRAVRSQLLDIARALDHVGGPSPFWESMRESGLILRVDRWRVEYRIDEARSTIEVLGVIPP